jgi:hypothetical protein
MKASRNVCYSAVAALSCLTSPLFAAGAQTPPSAPMTVVNTDTNPIPVRAPSPLPVSGNVTITGTPNVNVANTPNVNETNTPGVAQSGTWNVGILGVPAVAQNGTWNVGIAGTPSFALVTPTTPIPVTLGATDRTVVQFSSPNITFPVGSIIFGGTLYHNASNKVLVIEQVSMFVMSDNGTIGGMALQLTTTVNGMNAEHAVMQVEELPGNGRVGAKAVPVRIYVGPGTDIVWSGTRGDSAGASTISIAFSGYLTGSP